MTAHEQRALVAEQSQGRLAQREQLEQAFGGRFADQQVRQQGRRGRFLHGGGGLLLGLAVGLDRFQIDHLALEQLPLGLFVQAHLGLVGEGVRLVCLDQFPLSFLHRLQGQGIHRALAFAAGADGQTEQGQRQDPTIDDGVGVRLNTQGGGGQ